jgi:hypothetical protein
MRVRKACSLPPYLCHRRLRGDLAIVAAATSCLHALLEEDGVHLGYEEELSIVLEHDLVKICFRGGLRECSVTDML